MPDEFSYSALGEIVITQYKYLQNWFVYKYGNIGLIHSKGLKNVPKTTGSNSIEIGNCSESKFYPVLNFIFPYTTIISKVHYKFTFNKLGQLLMYCYADDLNNNEDFDFYIVYPVR